MIFCSFCIIVFILCYLYSFYLYGEFQKAIIKIRDQDNYFLIYGPFKIFIKILLLSIHPLVFLKGIDSGISESYFTSD